ncbi:MAG: hypothetical protein QM784_04945 [Polyangiaceae bacterium]
MLVGLRGLVDAKKEAERIANSIKKAEKDIGVLEKRLNNPAYVEKAPPELVTEVREQLASLKRQVVQLNDAKHLVDELG